VSALDQLVDDLWAIYFTAARDVTYVTSSGEKRAYWAKRFRMELELAIESQEAVDFAERLVRRAEPSWGFERLRRARRLDLTVEALVADPAKPYHQLFNPEAVRAARERLQAAGYPVPAAD
jgi:hypothetical protein